LQDAAREIQPHTDRVHWCLRARRSDARTVDIWRDIARNAPHYRGLIVCSQVWICPVCATKITERRKQELQAALARAAAAGYLLALVTSTFPHGRHDDLSELIAKTARARNLARGGKVANAIRHDVGLIGTVRCLEVTHGINGWHPHLHEIWVMAKSLELGDLEDRLYTCWRRAALKAGFDAPSRDHGVDVRGGSDAAHYVSKWGSFELTKAHTRRGRNEQRTPFDLLRLYADGIDRNENARLFHEYAQAFAGRRQLVWSRALRERLEIAEKSNEQLNQENRELAELLGQIDPRDWVLIREHGLRGEVLEIAREGWQPVVDFIMALRAQAGVTTVMRKEG
jgi:hypothetical protein